MNVPASHGQEMKGLATSLGEEQQTQNNSLLLVWCLLCWGKDTEPVNIRAPLVNGCWRKLTDYFVCWVQKTGPIFLIPYTMTQYEVPKWPSGHPSILGFLFPDFWLERGGEGVWETKKQREQLVKCTSVYELYRLYTVIYGYIDYIRLYTIIKQ